MDISRQALQLKKALNESRYTIAITGAGISFSAGGMNFDHENVAEIQGSLQINRCTKCGKHFDDYHIWNQGTVPRCDECGDVIWTFPFYSGVGLHEESLKKAQDWISKAELILIIGANGSYGNAYFNYRKRSAKIIQINPGETNFDTYASMNIRAGADEVFRLIV